MEHAVLYCIYNIIFKIKLYVSSRESPPPEGKILSVYQLHLHHSWHEPLFYMGLLQCLQHFGAFNIDRQDIHQIIKWCQNSDCSWAVMKMVMQLLVTWRAGDIVTSAETVPLEPSCRGGILSAHSFHWSWYSLIQGITTNLPFPSSSLLQQC
jgi:hypothetical protein